MATHICGYPRCGRKFTSAKKLQAHRAICPNRNLRKRKPGR